MTIEAISTSRDLSDSLERYPLMEALIERRSWRFGKGFRPQRRRRRSGRF